MKSIYKAMFTEMCCLYLDILIGGGICWLAVAKLLQKSEMRKDIVIELSYKGFG